MAHRTNIIQVNADIRPQQPGRLFTDPACGKRLERSQSKSVIFRGERTFYFCSTDCKDKFVHGLK